MTTLARMLEVLPQPYAVEGNALVNRLVNVCASEVDAFAEDVDRLRRSHWIERAFRGEDVDKLAALAGIRRFEGEPTPIFRERLRLLVTARLRGAVTPREIRNFVEGYLRAIERLLDCTLVPGLRKVPEGKAWGPVAKHPLFQPLAFVENPPRVRRSQTLRDRGGRVGHFFRWRETNRGVEAAPAEFRITGPAAMPTILNLTTRELLGFRGAIRPGRTLVLSSGAGMQATARMEGRDVTDRLYAIQPFVIGAPQHTILSSQVKGPWMARGSNELMFLAPAMYDQPALDRVSFLVEDPRLREAAYGSETAYDYAIFPTDTAAWLEMSWTELEPASFEIRIPRGVVVESQAMNGELRRGGMTGRPHDEIAADLRDTLPLLRAAGIRAELVLEPFSEIQEQFDRFTEPGRIVIDPELGPSGRDSLGFGALFDETPLNVAVLN